MNDALMDSFHLLSDTDDEEMVEPVIPADDEDVIVPDDPAIQPVKKPADTEEDEDDEEKLEDPDELEEEEELE